MGARSAAFSLIGDPLQVRREAFDHRDSDNLRKFVRVLCTDRRFDIRVSRGVRFHDDRGLLRSFEFALPVIE